MVPEEVLERATVDDVPPRYLRKQKPADASRRRMRHARSTIRRGALAFFITVALSGGLGAAAYVLLFSPAVLLHAAQIDIAGAPNVSRDRIVKVFSADMGRSVLRVPLAKRLAAIQKIPWVRQAAVERVLPDRINVSVVERQPVAFLSTRTGMKLIDADGVILGRPQGSNFNLPVVSGLDGGTPPVERARRLQLFSEFLKQIATVRPNAAAEVSDANLSNPDDVQVTLAGTPVLAGQGPVVVHFGNADFDNRFQQFLANFPTWQARAGNVEAVDLRYDGEALVTPAVPFSASRVAAAGNATTATTPPLSAQVSVRGNGILASRKNRKGSLRK